MKQILLALLLIMAPVAGFTGFQMYFMQASAQAAGLGDLSALVTIVEDVQGKAAAGDLQGAKERITDFETGWDEAEAGMRPLNPEAWGTVDQAADRAFKALRAATPDSNAVNTTLAALQAQLKTPTAKASN